MGDKDGLTVAQYPVGSCSCEHDYCPGFQSQGNMAGRGVLVELSKMIDESVGNQCLIGSLSSQTLRTSSQR